MSKRIRHLATYFVGAVFCVSCQYSEEDSLTAECRKPNGGILIPAGDYTLGEDGFYPEEGPVRIVPITAFEIDSTEVTNDQFADFVRKTGYLTRAEKGLVEEQYAHIPEKLRVPGSAVFVPPSSGEAISAISWWRFVEGASWRSPQGPGSSIDGMGDYPVVHIAFEDALAYANWVGRRLPTEDEWEAAARGGLEHSKFSGSAGASNQDVEEFANTWQGVFPFINQASDGYEGLSPVGCFLPNEFGIYDMIGNVWEWTSDSYNPKRENNVAQHHAINGEYTDDAIGVIKGGSFLCAENYCLRYRPAARQPQELLLGSSHIGFRTVGDTPN